MQPEYLNIKGTEEKKRLTLRGILIFEIFNIFALGIIFYFIWFVCTEDACKSLVEFGNNIFGRK